MKKVLFSTISILLVLTTMVSVTPIFVIAQDETKSDFEFSLQKPFIEYEDEKGIRYIGPTGNITEDAVDETEYMEAPEQGRDGYTSGKSELASVGNSTLPSSVDLSQSKYFPAVGNQGSLGSCATWATVYYQFTYEMNRMRGTAATPENTASPKFVYNILSQMEDSGTSAEENYAILKTQGAPSIATLPYDEKHLSWSADEKIWREALNCRLKDFKNLEYIGRDDREITSATDPDLDEIKSALNNGQMVTFSSYIYCWVFDTLKTHPDAPENSKYAGEKIVKYLDGTDGSHRMVIVGYNDEIWFDQNSNNKVDEGEKGAFKIANSWGTGFGNKGFAWVAYDAVNYTSSVEGGYAKSDRVGGMNGFTTITVRPYKEGSGIYLKFTLNTIDRTQFFVKVTTEHDGTTENATFLSDARYSKQDNNYSFWGNNYAEDGTFCFPLDNVSPDINADNFNDYSFSVTIKDSRADSKPLKVKNIEIVNEHTSKTYKPNVNLPTLDGSEQTIDVKSCDTDNKVIYYIGYDEPTLHYRHNGTWKEVEMEKNEEHLGHNYKYVIKDIPEDAYLYFTDKNGNADNNSSSYYVAKDRLNYFRTMGVREPLVLKDFNLDPEILDVGTNRYLISDVSGGYEPYYYQYTIEHIKSGKVEIEKFRTGLNIMHYFDKAGEYKITAEVKDQTGDIASAVKVINVTDMPFVFEELTATGEHEGNLFVSDNITFYARTNFEKIMYMKSTYDFVVTDSNGKVCYKNTTKSKQCSTNFGYSMIYADWIPAKKGTYTVTVSATDSNKEYAENKLTFTVLDKKYGDADGDGEVNVKDATILQKYLAGYKLDAVFRKDMADCDVNGMLSIKDATCIKKFVAKLDNSKEAGKLMEYVPAETEPNVTETEPVVTLPVITEKNIVTFTNSHNWSGTISCYYWSDSNTGMTTWPGKAMKSEGVNSYNETYYSLELPKDVQYIIFTNGSSQTVDISYSGGEVKFYPLSETDNVGHYKVANW